MNIGILISGNGSNLQALIDACATGHIPATIAVVISNKATAYGLERAKQAGIATVVLSHKDHASREDYDTALTATLEQHDVSFVCLAGFMRLLTPAFTQAWHDRLINIHPSLLPSFKGLDTHARAIAAGVKFTGCTVHFVRPAMDEGPIIIQARVFPFEHQCYVEALRIIATGGYKITQEKVILDKPSTISQSLIHPFTK
jgi:phosphoribosylglycinamide formyltransferase-1